MKKTLLALAFTGMCAAAFAQGTVNFGNAFSGSQGRYPIFGVNPDKPTEILVGQPTGTLGVPVGTVDYTGRALLQGTGFTFALFMGSANVTDAGSLSFITSVGFRTANGNLLPAGLVTTTTYTLPSGFAADSIAKFEIRAWDNRGGTITSWAQVLADDSIARGASGLFSTGPLGGGTTLAPNLVAQSFGLYTVPEPSTFALAGLASAAMLIFRRRR